MIQNAIRLVLIYTFVLSYGWNTHHNTVRNNLITLYDSVLFILLPIVNFAYRKRKKFQRVKLLWFFDCDSEVKFCGLCGSQIYS